MSDTTTPRKKRKLLIPVVAIVLLMSVIGFFASRAGLDKALVKQRLDAYVEIIKTQGAESGRDITLTYADLEVVGGLMDKHVVIKNPVLTVKPLEIDPEVNTGRKKPDGFVATTQELAVYPLGHDMSSLRLVLGHPLAINAPNEQDKSLLKVTASEPVEVTVGEIIEKNVPYITLAHTAPAKIEMTYLREKKAVGVEDATPEIVPVYEVLQVEFAPGSGFTSHLATDDSGLDKVNVAYKPITIMIKDVPDSTLTIAGIDLRWDSSLDEKKTNNVIAQAKVGPVTGGGADMPYVPLSFDLDATYAGALPKTAEDISSVEARDAHFIIKTFSLKTRDSELNVTGDFKAAAADPLPIGQGRVLLTNAQAVRADLTKYGMLDAKNEPMIMALIEKIAGQPRDAIKDLDITISRTANTSLKIGSATAEELFGLIMKYTLSAARDAGIPVDPNAPINPPANFVPAPEPEPETTSGPRG